MENKIDITKDIFKVYTFLNVQSLMELEGFNENSNLIVTPDLVNEYGYSAYMVRISWVNQL